MSKFCGNCGAQLDDSAKVCGFCGAQLSSSDIPGVSGDSSAPSIPGVNTMDPEKKAKITKYVKLGGCVVAVIVVISIIVNIISGFVGYKGAVRKIMNSYEKCDMAVLEDVISSYHKFRADESSYYDDLYDYLDSYYGDYFEYKLDSFEDKVGYKYKFSYEIKDHYELSERKFDDLMDDLNDDYDETQIQKIMVVKIQVKAKGTTTKTDNFTIQLSKEKDGWKLFDIDD